MPIHDWTRVDPNDYHDFHGAWIYSIRTALNNGLLPEGYFALAEHTTPPHHSGEETYQVAWQGFPAMLRKLVEETPASVEV